MACYSPLNAWRGAKGPSGKNSIVFSSRSSERGLEVQLPCGSCLGCRLERSRQWALRCVHESTLHDHNSFVTLTYSPQNLPRNGSLDPHALHCFIERVRARFGQVRYFGCGEYGESLERPHFHVLLFGVNFADKVLWKKGPEGDLFRSPTLEKLWKFGFSTIGEVTFQSAAYVASYVLKKVTGERAPGHYGDKYPEFVRMSRNPGLGRGWFEKFKDDVFPRDFVICEGKQLAVPKYYGKLFEAERPDVMAQVKRKRSGFHFRVVRHEKDGTKWITSDNDSFRLKVKGAVKAASIREKRRPLEGDNEASRV